MPFSRYISIATIIFFSVTIFCVTVKPVHATPTFNTTFSASASLATLNIIKQIRVNPSDGKVYVLGISTSTFGVFTADGSSYSNITYDVGLPAFSTTDMVINNNTIFLVISGSTNAVYQYNIVGSGAYFVSSNTGLASATAAMAFGEDGTIYVTKGTSAYTFDNNLNITATSTMVSIPTHLGYAAGRLFYQTSAGKFASLAFGQPETVIATSGPTGANIRGFAVSPDGSALYYASTSTLKKLLVTSGTTLWTSSVSNPAAIDINNSGQITMINASGTVSIYNPINPVSNFITTASSSNAVLNWTSGVSDSDFSGVTIRRSVTNYPTSIDDGSLVTSSAITSTFIDTGLVDATTYYYTIFNQTIDGYYSAGVTSSVTIDLPPEPPTLSASDSGSTINLSWTTPTDTDTFIIRRSTTDFPLSTTDGLAVTTTDFSITSLADTNLPDGVYYYSIFAADSQNNYSTAGTATAEIDTTGPATPNTFTATANGSTINLSWLNPVDSDFVSSIIRRSITNFPTSTTDGSLVTNTASTSYSDQSLTDGTYYYSIFALDANGNFSISTTSSATVHTSAPAVHRQGGVSFSPVLPSSLNTGQLQFLISGQSNPAGIVKVSSSKITLQLNADPTTVRGYALSFDPLFTNATITPLTDPSSNTFTLPDKAGTYTLYLKYYSLTGQASPILSQTVSYTPNISFAPKKGVTGFNRTLKPGMRGSDVQALQIFLNQQGYLVTQSGFGSPGYETNFYGPGTTRAIIKFQEAHKDAILKMYNLEKGTGIFGPATMAFIHTLQY